MWFVRFPLFFVFTSPLFFALKVAVEHSPAAAAPPRFSADASLSLSDWRFEDRCWFLSVSTVRPAYLSADASFGPAASVEDRVLVRIRRRVAITKGNGFVL